MQLHGKRILVMGLGVHGGGLGVARFLASQGADVTITDLRGPDALASSLAALEGLPIRLVLGEHREQDFREAEIVVRNPGVPHHSRFLQIARAAGAGIEMEMSLFFRLCPAPILGITGTKGKTTTTMLTAAMVREQFPGAVVAGNLRISALEQLPSLTAQTPVILELSSFALEGLGEAQRSPPFAAITNLTADHLDRYGSMEAYAEAKRQIYAWQGPEGVLALNADDPGTLAFYHKPPPGKRIWFSAALPETPRDGVADIGWRGSELIWRAAEGETALLSAEDMRLPGQHNRMNAAAAAALAFAFGVQPEALQRAVRGFAGVEHRLEFVRTLDGVRYINDTAATVPEAAIAALESFDAPIVLIAGGADKQLDFARFAEAIRSRVKALVLLNGTATPKLVEALGETMADGRWTMDDGEKTQDPAPKTSGHAQSMDAASLMYSDFEEAIRRARELASPGDLVLLSPGCASFGMFRNEFHRGEEFRRIVGELAE